MIQTDWKKLLSFKHFCPILVRGQHGSRVNFLTKIFSCIFFYDLNRFEDFLFNFEHFCPFLVRGDMGPGWIFWQKYVFALFKFLSFEHFWPLNQGPTQVRDQFCNKNIFSYFFMIPTDLKHFWPEVRGRCGSWVNFLTKIFLHIFSSF